MPWEASGDVDQCREEGCVVGINPAKDSLFDLTGGVPNCYLR
jgi:hypothetical protein